MVLKKPNRIMNIDVNTIDTEYEMKSVTNNLKAFFTSVTFLTFVRQMMFKRSNKEHDKIVFLKMKS